MDVPLQQDGQDVSFDISSDLSSYQYYGVKLSSGVLTTTHTKANTIVGVLQEKINGSSNTKSGRVRIYGITRAKAGDTITEMDDVIVDTDGTFIAADGANQSVVGTCLKACVDGDIFPLLLRGSETTTA